MRFKSIAAATLAALLAGALLAPVATAQTKPKTVGEDDAGDWGETVDPTLAPIGDLLGQDLTGAAIGMSDDGADIHFVITVNSLPPVGGVPEVTRYTWDFNLDGEAVKLDGKFTNYSRGACDPTSGQCPPPRDPGMQPFIVRGNCEVNEANVTICEELGIVQAEFDAGEGTITIPVPMELIGAKKRSKIAPSTGGLFGGTVEAMPTAFFSASNFPHDSLLATKTFRIPRK